MAPNYFRVCWPATLVLVSLLLGISACGRVGYEPTQQEVGGVDANDTAPACGQPQPLPSETCNTMLSTSSMGGGLSSGSSQCGVYSSISLVQSISAQRLRFEVFSADADVSVHLWPDDTCSGDRLFCADDPGLGGDVFELDFAAGQQVTVVVSGTGCTSAELHVSGRELTGRPAATATTRSPWCCRPGLLVARRRLRVLAAVDRPQRRCAQPRAVALRGPQAQGRAGGGPVTAAAVQRVSRSLYRHLLGRVIYRCTTVAGRCPTRFALACSSRSAPPAKRARALGLALVKAIVYDLSGDIEVESGARDTVFRLLLPDGIRALSEKCQLSARWFESCRIHRDFLGARCGRTMSGRMVW